MEMEMNIDEMTIEEWMRYEAEQRSRNQYCGVDINNDHRGMEMNIDEMTIEEWMRYEAEQRIIVKYQQDVRLIDDLENPGRNREAQPIEAMVE
nr:hypothetical protein [Tanacetum cinerariifolium]